MKQTEKTAKNETEPMEQAILRAAERLFLDKGFALTQRPRSPGKRAATRRSFITISARKRTFSRKFSNRKYGC